MYRKEKRIPTILGLLLVIGGLSTALFLDSSPRSLTSIADSGTAPSDIHISNVSDASFVVSWLTEKETIGSVIVSGSGAQITLLDDLDTDDIPRARTTHYNTVRNLHEDTAYTAQIITGSKNCQNNTAQCPTLSQKTGVKLLTSAPLSPLRGSVITASGSPIPDAIVYVTIGKSMPISTRTDSAGLWVLPLTNLRTQDLLTNLQLAETDLVHIVIKKSPEESTTALLDFRSIHTNSTVPSMILGNSYNFIDAFTKKGAPPVAQGNTQSILGSDAQKPSTGAIDILFPTKDTDTTMDTRPRLRGTGPPNKKLIISVNSISQTATLSVDKNGIWEWRPPKDLPSGIHTVKIQGYDTKGKFVTVTKKLIVLKSGERVLGESTPSATITSGPAATPTGPIPSPTIAPSPTMSLPSPTDVQIPTSPPAPPPRSGNEVYTLYAIGTGLVFLVAAFGVFAL